MQHGAGKYWRAIFFETATAFGPPPPAGDPFANTILRLVYRTACMKLKFGCKNSLADELCYATAHAASGALRHPQTWHVVCSALQAGDCAQYERHCCPLCGRVWPWIPRSEWGAHREDRCPFDGTPRFKGGGVPGSRLEPTRRCWIRPLREIVASFLRDPRVAAHIGTQRDWSDQGTFWGHPYARWLDEQCNGWIRDPRAGEIIMMLALGASLLSVRSVVVMARVGVAAPPGRCTDYPWEPVVHARAGNGCMSTRPRSPDSPRTCRWRRRENACGPAQQALHRGGWPTSAGSTQGGRDEELRVADLLRRGGPDRVPHVALCLRGSCRCPRAC